MSEPHKVSTPMDSLEYYRRLQMVEGELEKWKAMVGVGTKEDAETITALRARVAELERDLDVMCQDRDRWKAQASAATTK